MGKTILFVDMDGTLARFYEPEEFMEYRTDKEYFIRLRPYEALADAISQLMKTGLNVVMLSAVDRDIRENTIRQKDVWLETVFASRGVQTPKALYPESGSSKKEYVQSVCGDNVTAWLLDDHSPNLLSWNGGRFKGIKALNEINGAGEKWHGPCVNVDSDSADELYNKLVSIIGIA